MFVEYSRIENRIFQLNANKIRLKWRQASNRPVNGKSGHNINYALLDTSLTVNAIVDPGRQLIYCPINYCRTNGIKIDTVFPRYRSSFLIQFYLVCNGHKRCYCLNQLPYKGSNCVMK